MEEKISFTPVHACDQFPVNMPINTSRIPVITPVTVERMFAMLLNTPSNTGASRAESVPCRFQHI